MSQTADKIRFFQVKQAIFDLRGSITAPVKFYNSTIKFYRLPCEVSEIYWLNSGARMLCGVLDWSAGHDEICRVSTGLLARRLGTSRATIRHWAQELEQAGLVKIMHSRFCTAYRLTYILGRSKSLPLFNSVLERRDLSPSEKRLLSSLIFWQNDNDYSWWKQKDMAAVLGMSERTVRRVIASLSAKDLIQVGGGRHFTNHRNCYRITNAGMPEGGMFKPHCKPAGTAYAGKTTGKTRIFGSKINRTKATHLDKILRKESSLKRPSARSSLGILSKLAPRASPDPLPAFLKLTSCGVADKTARAIAYDQRQPYESIVQAIDNGRILQAWQSQEYYKQGLPAPRFNLPGYVVRAVTKARSEGKIIGTTRLFREAAARTRALQAARARATSWQPPSDAEIERRRREQKRALLSLPAAGKPACASSSAVQPQKSYNAPAGPDLAGQGPARQSNNRGPASGPYAGPDLPQVIPSFRLKQTDRPPAGVTERDRRRWAMKRALGLPA